MQGLQHNFPLEHHSSANLGMVNTHMSDCLVTPHAVHMWGAVGQRSWYSKSWLDHLGYEPQGGQNFLYPGSPSLLYNGHWVSFPGGKMAEAWL